MFYSKLCCDGLCEFNYISVQTMIASTELSVRLKMQHRSWVLCFVFLVANDSLHTKLPCIDNFDPLITNI